MNQRLHALLNDIKSALTSPTQKQKESYGRMAQTLSTASFIGAVTVVFTEIHATLYVTAKIAALFFWGMVLFLVGAILSKGE
jgi:hypothetical protein